MTARHVPLNRRLPILALAVLAICFTTLAADANAACFANPPARTFAAPGSQLGLRETAQPALAGKDTLLSNSQTVTGMWFAQFYKGTSTELWNQGFQLFHADGTEVSVDNAVPPSLGNVCVGVWKTSGSKTIKLRHLTWNWNADGTLAGIFQLEVTLRLDRHGNAYAGTYVSDSFDLVQQRDPRAARRGHREGHANQGGLTRGTGVGSSDPSPTFDWLTSDGRILY